MPKKNSGPLRLLLVDDDPLDAEVFQYCWEQTGVELDLVTVTDGDEAMSYLRREGKYQDAWRPNIILLDLNMPGKDGRETLSEIKKDPDLKSITVIVLTSSNLKSDIKKCFEAGADAYLMKPIGIKEYAKTVKELQDYWLRDGKLTSLC